VLRTGEVAVFDLRYATVIDIQTPFETSSISTSRRALWIAWADERDAPRVVECNVQRV